MTHIKETIEHSNLFIELTERNREKTWNKIAYGLAFIAGTFMVGYLIMFLFA